MSFTCKGVVSALVTAERALKAAILKAAAEAPKVLAVVEQDAPEVAGVVELAFPQAAAVEQTALAAFEVIAQAVEDAGPAAGANGLSVSLDQQLVADVKAVLPALKAFAAKL